MLPYAILSLLGEGADHGYRLKRRLDDRLGPVWPVNQGQVYQILDRFRRLGWVEELPPEVQRVGRRERWPVAITNEGRRALETWIRTPRPPSRPPEPARNDFLGQLLVGGARSVDAVRHGLEQERHAYGNAHARLTAALQTLEPPTGDVPRTAMGHFAARLAIEAARLSIRAHLDWIDLARRDLFADRPPPLLRDSRRETRKP